jgi:hypothetical protein
MAKVSVLVVAIIYIATMVGCATAPPPAPPAPPAPAVPAAPAAAAKPSWVDYPLLDGGLAASECVKNYQGQRSILMAKAKLIASGDLASQIETNVKKLSKLFAETTVTNEGMVSAEDFERVLKQITNQELMGARMSKSGYYEVEPGVQYLCVLMTLDPKHTRAFYDALMDKTGASDQLSHRDEEVLYIEFKASQAQKELDHATGN